MVGIFICNCSATLVKPFILILVSCSEHLCNVKPPITSNFYQNTTLEAWSNHLKKKKNKENSMVFFKTLICRYFVKARIRIRFRFEYESGYEKLDRTRKSSGEKGRNLNRNENKEGGRGGEGSGELRRPCWRENAERLVWALLVLHLFKVSPLLTFKFHPYNPYSYPPYCPGAPKPKIFLVSRIFKFLGLCVRNYSYKSGSCSRSSHQQAKKIRKPLISKVLWLLNSLLSLKT